MHSLLWVACNPHWHSGCIAQILIHQGKSTTSYGRKAD
jgi:hypothetical protein